MSKKTKAEVPRFGSKNPFDYFSGNQRLYVFNYDQKAQTSQLCAYCLKRIETLVEFGVWQLLLLTPIRHNRCQECSNLLFLCRRIFFTNFPRNMKENISDALGGTTE